MFGLVLLILVVMSAAQDPVIALVVIQVALGCP